MKKLGIIGTVLCMIFLVSFFVSHYAHNCFVQIGNTPWDIEIAETPEQRERGLMHRMYLCDTCGMLFVFDDMAPRNFWMKNTRIPLDIYFYDSEGMLVDVAHNMRPEIETEYPMDYTSQPAQYAIEVTAGSSLFLPDDFDPRTCF